MMTSWSDSLNRLRGKTRFVVCRLFIHLVGAEIAPILGVLNQKGREAIDAEGDLSVLGEGLVEICQKLLEYDIYWQSAANEGEVFWSEGEAADYVNELFTDSGTRYLSGLVEMNDDVSVDSPLSIPITRNIVVIITVAYEGERAELETDLADINALRVGLKTLMNLHYQNNLRAIQIHFSPARLGDELTADQILSNFPELIPL